MDANGVFMIYHDLTIQDADFPHIVIMLWQILTHYQRVFAKNHNFNIQVQQGNDDTHLIYGSRQSAAFVNRDLHRTRIQNRQDFKSTRTCYINTIKH